MKQLIISASLILGLTLFSNAQNTLFIGDKTYTSTEKFKLKSNIEYEGHDLNVLIAKKGVTGMIVISADVMTQDVQIRGSILIYLEDNTVITCLDKGKHDFVDNTTTTIYYLTEAEITKLKNSNIRSIRFSLKCPNGFSTEEGNFSASNKSYTDYTKGFTNNKIEKTDVPSLILDLFAN